MTFYHLVIVIPCSNLLVQVRTSSCIYRSTDAAVGHSGNIGAPYGNSEHSYDELFRALIDHSRPDKYFCADHLDSEIAKVGPQLQDMLHLPDANLKCGPDAQLVCTSNWTTTLLSSKRHAPMWMQAWKLRQLVMHSCPRSCGRCGMMKEEPGPGAQSWFTSAHFDAPSKQIHISSVSEDDFVGLLREAGLVGKSRGIDIITRFDCKRGPAFLPTPMLVSLGSVGVSIASDWQVPLLAIHWPQRLRSTSGDWKVFEGDDHEEEVAVKWASQNSVETLQSVCSTMQSAILNLHYQTGQLFSDEESLRSVSLPSISRCSDLMQGEGNPDHMIDVLDHHMCRISQDIHAEHRMYKSTVIDQVRLEDILTKHFQNFLIEVHHLITVRSINALFFGAAHEGDCVGVPCNCERSPRIIRHLHPPDHKPNSLGLSNKTGVVHLSPAGHLVAAVVDSKSTTNLWGFSYWPKWYFERDKGQANCYGLSAQCVLAELLQTLSPSQTFVELGVNMGETSEYILQRTEMQYFGVDHFGDVDLWGQPSNATGNSMSQNERQESDIRNERYHGEVTDQDRFWAARMRILPFGERARLLRASSADAAAVFPLQSLDALFVDAGHSFTDVSTDLQLWAPKVKSGGILAGHDFEFPRYSDVIVAVYLAAERAGAKSIHCSYGNVWWFSMP